MAPCYGSHLVQAQNMCVEVSSEGLGLEENFSKMWHMIFVKHLQVIERFGRFPHRNAFLGRVSSQEEQEFINDPKYRFDLPVKLTVDPVTGAAGFEFIMSENQAADPESTKLVFGPGLPAEPQLLDSKEMTNARQIGYIAPEDAAVAERRGSLRKSSMSQSTRSDPSMGTGLCQRSMSWQQELFELPHLT